MVHLHKFGSKQGNREFLTLKGLSEIFFKSLIWFFCVVLFNKNSIKPPKKAFALKQVFLEFVLPVATWPHLSALRPKFGTDWRIFSQITINHWLPARLNNLCHMITHLHCNSRNESTLWLNLYVWSRSLLHTIFVGVQWPTDKLKSNL